MLFLVPSLGSRFVSVSKAAVVGGHGEPKEKDRDRCEWMQELSKAEGMCCVDR